MGDGLKSCQLQIGSIDDVHIAYVNGSVIHYKVFRNELLIEYHEISFDKQVYIGSQEILIPLSPISNLVLRVDGNNKAHLMFWSEAYSEDWGYDVRTIYYTTNIADNFNSYRTLTAEELIDSFTFEVGKENDVQLFYSKRRVSSGDPTEIEAGEMGMPGTFYELHGGGGIIDEFYEEFEEGGLGSLSSTVDKDGTIHLVYQRKEQLKYINNKIVSFSHHENNAQSIALLNPFDFGGVAIAGGEKGIHVVYHESQNGYYLNNVSGGFSDTAYIDGSWGPFASLQIDYTGKINILGAGYYISDKPIKYSC